MVRKPHNLVFDNDIVHIVSLAQPERKPSGSNQHPRLHLSVRLNPPPNFFNRASDEQLASLNDADLVAHFGQLLYSL